MNEATVANLEVATAAAGQEQYSDFSTQTDFATFKLAVEEKVLFINPYTIAEMSPVFAVMFFNSGFDEKKEQMAHIKEDKYEELLEMFRCLLPCSLTKKKIKSVTMSNLCQLLKLSDKYQIKNLRIYCETFIDEEFQKEKIEIEDSALISLLQAAVDFNLNKAALTAIIGRVAELPTKTLKESKVVNTLPGRIVGELLFTKLRIESSSNKHSFDQQNTGTVKIFSGTPCSWCRKYSTCVHCVFCKYYFCFAHIVESCSSV